MANNDEHFRHFISCVLSVRKNNTPDWMRFIAKEINRACESIGEHERFCFDGDGIKPDADAMLSARGGE